MQITLTAFKEIGQSFKNLCLEHFFETSVKGATTEGYELCFHQASETLTKLLTLKPDEKRNIPGYISSEHSYENHSISRKFATYNYSILCCKDNKCDSNFSKYNFEVTDNEDNVILKKTTLYDINNNKTEVTYEGVPDCQKKMLSVIEMAEQDIKDTKKNTAIINMRKLKENIVKTENGFKPQ